MELLICFCRSTAPSYPGNWARRHSLICVDRPAGVYKIMAEAIREKK